VAFTVGQLIENNKPVTVYDTDLVRDAQRLMVDNKFSQLPVINKRSTALGMITSDSILRALSTFGATLDQMRVLDAMDGIKHVYRDDDDIFLLLDDLKDTNAVLIVDHARTLIGLVTSYDITEYFRRRAEDMIYAEEIETMLKEYINAYFMRSDGKIDLIERDKAVAAVDPKKTFDTLSQHNYVTMLLHPDRWSRYSSVFSFDRDIVLKLLDDARKTRNAAAHFHSQEITPEQRERLKFCRDWLARYESIIYTIFGNSAQEVEEQSDIKYQETPPTLMEEPITANDIKAAEGSLSEETRRIDNRYAPLTTWLQKQPLEEERVSRSFKQIEELINDELPASARLYRTWWSNNLKINPLARQWWEAGWRVSTVSLSEEKVVFTRIEERKSAYIDFFSTLLAQLSEKNPSPMKTPSPDGESWLIIARLPDDGPKVASLGFSFARRRRFRVELYIDTGNDDSTRKIFENLLTHKQAIEAELGLPLNWESLEGARASRIAIYHSGAITDSEDELAALRTWAVDTMIRFQKVMTLYLTEAFYVS